MDRRFLSRVIGGETQFPDVVRPAAESKGVRLVVDLDPEMGAFVGDPDRLQQIVWNLLANAVRFTPKGGRVMVTAHRRASATAEPSPPITEWFSAVTTNFA